jgi:hypothetical protein
MFNLIDCPMRAKHLTHIIKPGTLGDRWKPMTIRLDSAPFVGCRCPRVADANFAVGGRQYIGSHTDATDDTR